MEFLQDTEKDLDTQWSSLNTVKGWQLGNIHPSRPSCSLATRWSNEKEKNYSNGREGIKSYKGAFQDKSAWGNRCYLRGGSRCAIVPMKVLAPRLVLAQNDNHESYTRNI